MDEKGRHEHKLNINYADYMQLSSRLRHIAKFDENALNDGSYIIRSLYFDNYADKAVVEKLSGASRREKFRIRFYNDDPSFIRLEKKSKANRLCYKKNAPITVEQCEGILAGNWGLLKESGQELLMELYTKMHYQNLRPRTIVDYKRETYVYHAGNVRITFDSNIRTSNNVSSLFNPELVTIPAASAIVLEIKYDGFIPEIIRQLVRVDSRNETEFSKYVVSRLI
ncbi:MAG TPA: molecular chaperone [Lachnoclostridium sp.]|uniref:polyphosphate polymerase domain-containing protein n=1 Tax=Lacrimispora sp. TaxID=2719234 RepID=UPI000ED65763|nr:polyphosphate polymerase domain-containing protein [Lacrimispora sp.]HCD44677.1 molecular chaperone [Lachnoclostridium sp.]